MVDYLFRPNVVFRAISYLSKSPHRPAYCRDFDFHLFRTLVGGEENFRTPVNSKFPANMSPLLRVWPATPPCVVKFPLIQRKRGRPEAS